MEAFLGYFAEEADNINLESLMRLEQELSEDLHQLLTLRDTVGMEGFTSDTLRAAGLILASVSKKLGVLTQRTAVFLRNQIQETFLRYTAIARIWESRLKNNVHQVDEDKFRHWRLSIVPVKVLHARIAAVSKVHFILDNLERVCDAPVRNEDADWRTPEFMAAYQAMREIGFDANRYDVIKKASARYEQAALKLSLEDHGYSLHELVGLVQAVQPIARYADKDHVQRLSQRVGRYAEALSTYEDALTTNDDLDAADKKERLRQLDVRVARLWWTSHFIKAIYRVMHDIVTDVLRLCKIAERCYITA